MVQRVKESERTESVISIVRYWHYFDMATLFPIFSHPPFGGLALDWSFEEKWTKRVFKTSPARYDRVNVTRTAMVSVAQWHLESAHWILGWDDMDGLWSMMVYGLDMSGWYGFGSFWMRMDWMILRLIFSDNSKFSKLATPRFEKFSERTIKAAIRFLGWLCRLCGWACLRPWNTLWNLINIQKSS